MKEIVTTDFDEKYRKLTDKWFNIEANKPEETLSGKIVYSKAYLQIGILPDGTVVAREV